jgi:hypothetical protein
MPAVKFPVSSDMRALTVLSAQAEEVRTLSTQVAADAAKSIEGGIHKMK